MMDNTDDGTEKFIYLKYRRIKEILKIIRFFFKKMKVWHGN